VTAAQTRFIEFVYYFILENNMKIKPPVFISSNEYVELKEHQKNKGLLRRIITIFIKNQLAAMLIEFLILLTATSIVTALAGGWLISPFFSIPIQGICIGLLFLTLFLDK
jgi:hypothetical protein